MESEPPAEHAEEAVASPASERASQKEADSRHTQANKLALKQRRLDERLAAATAAAEEENQRQEIRELVESRRLQRVAAEQRAEAEALSSAVSQTREEHKTTSAPPRRASAPPAASPPDDDPLTAVLARLSLADPSSALGPLRRAPIKGPSGPRRAGEGTEEEEQAVVTFERLANGGVQLRVTLLAAGFVIGAAGASVREISASTGAVVQSWSEGAVPGCHRPTRVFRVQGQRKAVAAAVEIIHEAVERYKELCEGKRRGEFVQRQQRIRGVEFAYQPPPRSVAPHAAALGSAPGSEAGGTSAGSASPEPRGGGAGGPKADEGKRARAGRRGRGGRGSGQGPGQGQAGIMPPLSMLPRAMLAQPPGAWGARGPAPTSGPPQQAGLPGFASAAAAAESYAYHSHLAAAAAAAAAAYAPQQLQPQQQQQQFEAAGYGGNGLYPQQQQSYYAQPQPHQPAASYYGQAPSQFEPHAQFAHAPPEPLGFDSTPAQPQRPPGFYGHQAYPGGGAQAQPVAMSYGGKASRHSGGPGQATSHNIGAAGYSGYQDSARAQPPPMRHASPALPVTEAARLLGSALAGPLLGMEVEEGASSFGSHSSQSGSIATPPLTPVPPRRVASNDSLGRGGQTWSTQQVPMPLPIPQPLSPSRVESPYSRAPASSEPWGRPSWLGAGASTGGAALY